MSSGRLNQHALHWALVLLTGIAVSDPRAALCQDDTAVGSEATDREAEYIASHPLTITFGTTLFAHGAHPGSAQLNELMEVFSYNGGGRPAPSWHLELGYRINRLFEVGLHGGRRYTRHLARELEGEPLVFRAWDVGAVLRVVGLRAFVARASVFELGGRINLGGLLTESELRGETEHGSTFYGRLAGEVAVISPYLGLSIQLGWEGSTWRDGLAGDTNVPFGGVTVTYNLVFAP